MLVVYADLLFLLNALFDCILLLTTALIWKEKSSIFRIILSLIIGSLPLYSLVFSELIFFNSLFGKLVVAFAMICISFQITNIRKLVKFVSTFYFLTFFTGGTITALQNLILVNNDLLQGNIITQNTIHWVFVLLVFPISIWFYKKHIGSIQMFSIKSTHIVPVIVKINEKEIQFNGLIDTGNQLTDPLTRTPVVIMSSSMIHRMLPENIVCVLQDQKKLLSVIENIDEWKYRFTFVPYKVVGREHNTLTCVKPDEIKVFYEDKWLVCKKVYIGMNTFTISSDKTFDLILHPLLLTIHSNSA